MHNGIMRTYIVYVPAIYNANTAVPLLFNLHGYSSTNSQQQFYGNFMAIADTANFIMVLPNGTLDGQNQRFWNTFGGSSVDDVGFINALIDTIAADYSIDLNRVYSTGMSNGGFMSYQLACSLSNRITAIASVTGSMITPNLNACQPWRPVPVMEIHGTADATVPYEGGQGFTHIDTLVKYWVEFNECTEVDSVDVADIDNTDGCTAKHYVYSGGSLGSSVELYKIIGGGHTWPGALFPIGVTNQDINASREIWRFFSQYNMSMFATNIAEIPNSKGYSVFPNPSASGFTLSFATGGLKTISVYNTLGALIKMITVTDTQTQLDIETPGLYFVTVNQTGKVFTQKVIRY